MITPEEIGAIDWEGSRSHFFINPRTPDSEKEEFLKLLRSASHLNSHCFLLTSGTTGKKKWVALAHHALLSSAAAVNRHLQVSSRDIWINPLPVFHVGGLSIYVRAKLSGSRVVSVNSGRWDMEGFIKSCEAEKGTLSALVPTQVYDCVQAGIKAPASLRAVVVGGGALNEAIYESAVCLGWPLLPSYGLTECSSQVATALLGSWMAGHFPELPFLDHVETGFNPEGYLQIRSEALLTAYVGEEGVCDPKKEGWFSTEDRITLGERGVVNVSRGTGFVKIGGESVDLQRLQQILEGVCIKQRTPISCAIAAKPDLRKGSVIELLVEGTVDPLALVEQFNQQVLPFERICHVTHVKTLPRTALGKILIRACR